MPASTYRQLSVMEQAIALAMCLLLTFAAGATGAFASADAGAFYQALARPRWAPPPWLFAPVWTVLYLLMAIAAWLVWRAHGLRRAGTALALFVAQLAANALWPWLFFVWKQGGLAFAGILALWVLVASTAVSFARLDRLAASLLLPYLVWVTFAGALTLHVWQANRAILGEVRSAVSPGAS